MCITFGFGAVEDGKGTVGIGPSCTTHCSPTFTTLAVPTANVVATVVALAVVAVVGATVEVTVGAVVDEGAEVDATVAVVATADITDEDGANVVGSTLVLLVEQDEASAVMAAIAQRARTFRPIRPDHQSTEATAE